MKAIQSGFPGDTGGKQCAAFTLTELAVVLATVALLALISLPALAATKGQTRIGQCVDNLRQFALALQMFGAENNDKQPVSSGGNWAWDLSWSAGNSVTQYVSFKKLYCPGTGVRFSDLDNANLWNFGPGLLHVPGYLTTFPGTTIVATNQNVVLTPQRILAGGVYLPAPPAAQRVLVADGTISDYPTDNHAGVVAGIKYNFAFVPGGYTVPHISPHLNGLVPAGCNVGMLDGHVQWRKFYDMDQRASSASQRGFWW
jgi:prepilin-type processing-associated H-X9-DG protein